MATASLETPPAPSPPPRRPASIVPALQWLPASIRTSLRADLVAGVTLATYLLPAGLADASLANLPPEAGLYACLFSGLVFWVFCSSRHTAITVTSAISVLMGTSLGAIAGGDPSRFAALAACTALMVGALAFVAWLVRAGTLVSFVSETVMVGFKSGVALFIASTQLPKLFGVKGGHGSFWERMGTFFSHLGGWNGTALALGLGALTLLVLGKKYLPNRPVALLVVLAGIVTAAVFDAEGRGVKLLGPVPQGLPDLGLPAVSWNELNELLPLALACFMLGAVETVAIGRMFARKHGGRFDVNQELLGLAAANLGAGIGRGFPVSGGMSQSLVNESGGARTPFSGLVAALVVLVVTLFLSDLLRTLPQPVLAAIVLMAIAGLFKLDELKHLWRYGRSEFAIAAAALAGVLGSGLLRGVLIGALISLVLLLRRAANPPVAVLGRVPGTTFFGNIEHDPGNERIPGVFVFRVDSALLYFNCENLRERFLELLDRQPAPCTLAIWSLSTSPLVDLAAAEMLVQLHKDLAARGIDLALADARGPVRTNLRAAGVDIRFGAIESNMSVDAVLRAKGRGSA